MIKKNGGIFGRNPTYNDVVVEGVLTLKEAQVFDNDITINGDLTVNGTETVINTVELNVDDKNITMGAATAKVGLTSTSNITAGQFTVLVADTAGLVPGMTVTKTAGTGAFGASSKIASVDSHYQITLTVAHATSGSITFDTGGATDDTADGGGLTLKGTTDKLITWVKSKLAWVFSEPIETGNLRVDTNTISSTNTNGDINLSPNGTGSVKTSKANITGGSISGITDLAVADGGTGASTAADARTNLGVTATGSDTTYAYRANNLSDLSNASTARANLGLGTMATQAASNVAITGGSISGITDLAVADGGTGASTAADARTNLGLGTMATQAANNVSITGGSVSGITDLAVADGGTGASTAADARTNLGLGTMATQAASNVAITGGAIDGTPIGGTTAAAITGTDVRSSGHLSRGKVTTIGANTNANIYTIALGPYTGRGIKVGVVVSLRSTNGGARVAFKESLVNENGNNGLVVTDIHNVTGANMTISFNTSGNTLTVNVSTGAATSETLSHALEIIGGDVGSVTVTTL